MKKRPQRLQLNRETVQLLGATNLQEAAGGSTGDTTSGLTLAFSTQIINICYCFP